MRSLRVLVLFALACGSHPALAGSAPPPASSSPAPEASDGPLPELTDEEGLPPREHDEHTATTEAPFVEDLEGSEEPEAPGAGREEREEREAENAAGAKAAAETGRLRNEGAASGPEANASPAWRPPSRSTPRRAPLFPRPFARTPGAGEPDPLYCLTHASTCRSEAFARWQQGGLADKEWAAGAAAGVGAVGGMAALVGGSALLLYQTQGDKGLELVPFAAVMLGMPSFGVVVGLPLGLAAGAGAFLATWAVSGLAPAIAAGTTAAGVIVASSVPPLLGWLGPFIAPPLAATMAAACAGAPQLEE